MSTLKVADGLIHLAVMEGSCGLFFHEENGRYITSFTTPVMKRLGYAGQQSLILNGECYNSGTYIDLKSGSLQRDNTISSSAGTAWCGITTYAPGTGVLGHSTLGYKTPCGVGAWVAGGVLLYSPSICTCDNHMPGSGAYVSGREIYEKIKNKPEHPLVKGPEGQGSPPSGSEIENGGWTAYRGGSRHQGSSAATVGRSVKTFWVSKPEHPFSYTTIYNSLVDQYDERPVPPVVVTNLVYTAGSDGIVTALNLSDGSIKWKQQINGSVLTSIAYEAGRLFVPGADGWVYALHADTGQLLWKRRVAPLERRIAVFDNLMSTWPVLSLAVDEGTVYATAGMSIICGSTTLALDTETGEIRWRRAIDPVLAGSHLPPDGDAVGLGGVTAVINDAVWVAGYGSIPLCLNKKDGTVVPLPSQTEQSRSGGNYFNFRGIYHMQGQNIIAVNDRCVLGGGRPLFENHQLREGKWKRVEFKLYHADENGWLDLTKAPARMLNISRLSPACDPDLIAYAAPPPVSKNNQPQRESDRSTSGLNVWKVADFVEENRVMMQEDPGMAVIKWTSVHRPLNESKALWSRPDLDMNALALAGDALIVTHAGSAKMASPSELPEKLAQQKPLIQYSDWRLTAFERESGEEMWMVSLPSEPLYDGLAVAADGTIIVTLRDGSVLAVRKEL